MKLTGREKATIFLSILGPDTSAQILRYLPGELADMIASGINHLPTPTPEALGSVLEDFKSYLALPAPGAGPAKPAKPAEPKLEIPIEKMSPKEILLTAPLKRLAFVLADESPQMVAYVLAFQPEDRREEVLLNLPSLKEKAEAIIKDLKKSPLAAKLEEKIIKHFADKIWA